MADANFPIPCPHATLRAEALGKDFPTRSGPLTVLRDVSLSLTAGEAVVIMGPSGSGKSTLLNIFGTLEPPSRGTLRFGECEPFALAEAELARLRNEQVGFVFQDHHLLPQCSVLENVLIPTLPARPEPDVAARARQLLERVGLADRLEHRPAELSGGERQRVAVASVLACKPEILVLDEPTTGLDYSQQKSMMELLRSLNDAGHTIIIITHALWVVAEYAHRAVVINNGSIIMDGTVREVFSKQDELESVGMRLPEIIKLGNMLGKTLLSVDEYKAVIKD